MSSIADDPHLTEDEAAALAEHEAVIEHGLAAFVEVGEALLTINEQRLYRETHKSFAAYLADRWGLGRSHGYRLMEAARQVGLIAEVSPNGDIPRTEAQARALRPVKNLNVRARVLDRIRDDGGFDEVTAEDIARIVAEETAEEERSAARNDELGYGALIGVRETAAKIRENTLEVYFQRRVKGFGDAAAIEWLVTIRDDAALIVEQASALLAPSLPGIEDLAA